MRTLSGFSWPLRFLPALRAAGTFPMTVPDCNRAYRSPVTAALHLHDYSGDIWIGKTRYRLQPGDITISPHGGTSRYALKESGSHLCIHFVPPASGRGASVKLPLHLRLGPQVATARERFWRTIDHARQAGGKADSPSGAAASASMQELLLWLQVQDRRGAAPRRSSLMEEALEKFSVAIERRLGEPVLVENLAQGTGLSADYVARLFSKRYGMTVQHYLLLRRVELARHLLLSSDLLVSEIGQRVGMPDPQYFNKQFRRVAGVSPLAYRRQGAPGKASVRRERV
jgi:AraC-like DNA-binding protein